MREIKTRKKSKGVKPLEKGVSTGDRMKNTFLRSKEKASRTTDTRTEAPNEYASDQLQAGVDEVGHDAGQIAVSTSDFAFRKGREAVQRRRAKTKDGQEPTQHPFDILS